MTRRPLHAVVRSGHLVSRWLRAVALLIVLVLVGTLLTPGAPAAAEDLLIDRDLAVADMISGGPSLRRAAEAALLGSDDDMRAYSDAGRIAAAEADERAAAQVLAGMDGPATRAAALAALDGSRADVQAFVEGGYQSSWDADERLRVHRILEAGGLRTKEAAQRALGGTKEELTEFLLTGRDTAERADDRLAATRMLTGGSEQQRPGARRRRAAGAGRHPGGAARIPGHRSVRGAGPRRRAGLDPQPDRAGQAGRRD